ncbi:MAG TPA: PIN domain nuclease [Acidobacteria bacterium]|nr:PIN domain nuclease [Acidobacteriota bacterium]
MSPGENRRSCVLDASALLAFLRGEPGGEVVEEMLGTSAISSVNWSEVIQKALEHKIPVKGLREELESLGLEILPFTAGLAEKTAGLREETRSFGLSLGDRACLALAADLGRPAVTTDRVWADLDLRVEVRVVR